MLKKVLLCEFAPEKGHKNLFANTYDLLSKNFSVQGYVLSDRNRDDDDKYNVIPFAYFERKYRNYLLHRISYIFYVLKITLMMFKQAKKNGNDALVCLTNDDVALFLSLLFFKCDVPLYVMHHYELDFIATSKIRKWMFNSIKGKYYHIVQADFMAKKLVKDFDVPNEMIIVWPHPLNIKMTRNTDGAKFDCAGLSNSNEEVMIENLIKLEKEQHVFKMNNLHVILKSRNSSYNNDYLTVINGYLPDQKYDSIINGAKSLFIPFPDSFNTRMSGTLIDALSNRKYVIATRISVVESCRNRYSNLIEYFVLDNFIETIKLVKDKNPEEETQFDEFVDNHSDEKLAAIMFQSFCHSSERKNVRIDF